jgi:hypothetical protein
VSSSIDIEFGNPSISGGCKIRIKNYEDGKRHTRLFYFGEARRNCGTIPSTDTECVIELVS